MNERADMQSIARLSGPQGGVYTQADLRTALGEPHKAAYYRRVDRLVEEGILRRFSRGFYIAAEFELPVLSQRIAPDSAVSFETVLAQELVIGPRPLRSIAAIRGGRSATYAAHGYTIQHHQLGGSLRFGEVVDGGVRRTDAEKALLDVLTFHLRGRKALFDLHSDVNLERLNRNKLRAYLRRYKNPKLIAFARELLHLP